MTKDEVIERLKVDMILNHGSWGAFANYLGVSKTLMSMIINGSREPNKAILDHVGVEKKVIYSPLEA
ncbi:MAG: hypothetical protein ACPGUE_22015 [Marinomonas sp.]